MKNLHRISGACALILLSACVAKQVDRSGVAQDSSYGHWQVVVTAENDPAALCYAVSAPTHVEGTFNGKRNNPYLMATRRKSGRIEVSASSGYNYKKDSDVEIEISKDKFSLKPKDSVAWATDDAQDKDMLDAMKAIGPVEVRGVTAKGETTGDIYSTVGFKEALARVRELCP